VAVPILPILYTTMQLGLLMGLGYILRRRAGFSEAFFSGLSRLVVNVALPLYFFVRMSRADLSVIRGAAVMPLLAVLIIGLGFLVSVPLFAALGFTASDRRAGVALSSFGNSGYIPLTLAELLPAAVPAVMERYGSELSSVYIGAYLFAMSPILWSVGNLILTSATGAGVQGITVRKIISPPLLGIISGLLVPISGLQPLFTNPQLPFGAIVGAAERVSALTVPLALFTLGALIANLVEQEEPAERLWPMAIAVTGVRLLVMPALFYALYVLVLRPLAAAPVVVFVAFLEMHTPPAANFSVMAGRSGMNREHTAFSMLVSYAAFVVLMPFLTALFLTLVR
jgi:malate permease and related proteins